MSKYISKNEKENGLTKIVRFTKRKRKSRTNKKSKKTDLNEKQRKTYKMKKQRQDRNREL